MLRAPEVDENTSTDPYLYARVIGIYHANVWAERSDIPNAKKVRRMDFLWVRWLGEEPDYVSGLHCARLPKIGFVESSDEYAFSFLDPANIVRGCHLIPDFDAGRTPDLLPFPKSIARCLNPGDVDDWVNFYVNVFVDRDMVMRYFGGGIGHLENSPPSQSCADDSDSEMDSDNDEDDLLPNNSYVEQQQALNDINALVSEGVEEVEVEVEAEDSEDEEDGESELDGSSMVSGSEDDSDESEDSVMEDDGYASF
ncbi:hypothetical protein BDN70DRAFT_813932 [Pholiota conissans]|uniref:Uncharacterized protein n=1 Tax=Pholiota conissans TaxID=109636 RepID=A0A9P5YUA6_9AGAR|nr:hypothetical protein BDN70DRAFT_813932 [Pholiota conissans]